MKARSCLILIISLISIQLWAQNENTISLDGQWEIIFDIVNEGRDASWELNKEFEKQKTTRKINVPSAWELIEKDYEGVAFYRRKFDVPANWSGAVMCPAC